ncbi:MAG: helix-turn-helix domain-containing protein [Acidobacteriota bacterium]|nr:helix-turn-helix domain-containing protein [Acidobacteriota bacterium]
MPDIGATLREARMRARIDISEVEVGTKIRAKYLRALENEEWDLLPGPIYVKSFLRTYGDYLGLDSRLLVDEFKRRYERPSDHEVRVMASTARERDRRSAPSRRLSAALLTPRTVIVFALIVIVAALYVIGNQNGKSPSGTGNRITPATNTTHHHHTGTGAGKHGGGANTGATTTGTTTKPPPPKLATLELVPTSTVWICVENQAGRPLMTAGDYTAGQTLPRFRARQLLLTLGNTGVTMTANGKAYTPTVPTGSAAVALRITPTAVTPLSSAPTCG